MSGNWTTPPHLAPASQALISVLYAVGILANTAALAILCSGRKYRNHKHTLMLRFLTGNDLVALAGMLVQMYLQLHGVAGGRPLCIFRVVWRFFGFSSGCVAIVMAVERWLALTHPFVYQKHVTPAVIKRGIFGLWLLALLLVCLPFAGFGLYYRPAPADRCERYKDATSPVDRAYAFLFCAVGMLMVVCLVLCNVSVIRALCRMGLRGRHGGGEVLGRRISRSSSRSGGSRTAVAAPAAPAAAGSLCYNSSTREELTFARLMGLICVVFVVCWLPQMVSILLAQFLRGTAFTRSFGRLADILLSLHYTLNPFIYVLLSCRGQPCLPGLLKLLCRSCRRRSGASPSAPGSLAMTEHEQLESTEATSGPGVTSSLI
ncbi:prostaglandin E2 receptor EP4 subtype [Bacillus rossius redtenbacheri]|uniref:prostaglandin E2 receptor EP4 subtype n=1 Tax=Bacillus rossius redtenbacheri TaxID=93214 RepID=UPI002FDEA2B5